MLKSILTATKNGKELHSMDGWEEKPVLITATYGSMHGSFVAETRSSAGTTTVTAARSNDAIVLTDLILTTDKVAGASATVSITDGVNTEVVIAAKVNDAPAVIAIPLQGHWQTWQGCRIDLVTVNAVTATLALGYFRIAEADALTYAEWDALR